MKSLRGQALRRRCRSQWRVGRRESPGISTDGPQSRVADCPKRPAADAPHRRTVVKAQSSTDGRADFRGYISEAQCFRPGDWQRLPCVLRPRHRGDRHIGDGVRVDERNCAAARSAAGHTVGLDRVRPIEEVVHEPGGLHEGETDSAVTDRGFALSMPRLAGSAVSTALRSRLSRARSSMLGPSPTKLG